MGSGGWRCVKACAMTSGPCGPAGESAITDNSERVGVLAGRSGHRPDCDWHVFEDHVIERLNIYRRPRAFAHVCPATIRQRPPPSLCVSCAKISNLATLWLQNSEQLLRSLFLSAKRKPAQL